MARKYFTAEKGGAILNTLLRMKGIPFESVVADLVGVPRATLNDWIRHGLALSENDQDEHPQAEFAVEFRRIQAKWIDNATAFVMESEQVKERAAAVKNIQWGLERLRRELFDLSRPPKEAKPGETNMPVHKGRTAKEVADDLANPELQ